MHLRIRTTKDLVQNIGIALFIFFFLTVDFRSFIFHNVAIAYCFALINLVLLFLGTKTRFDFRINQITALWIISIAFVIRSGEMSLIVKYSFGLFLLYCFSTTFGTGTKTVKIFVVFGLIFATTSFFFSIFPEVYINNVVPHLEEYLRTAAVYMINSKRYPGLTGNYGTNGIYLSFGVGAAFSCYVTSESKRYKRIYLIFSAICFAALLLIGKRAHLVFSAIACFIVYWISNNQNQSKRFVRVIGLLLVALSFVEIGINVIPSLSNTFDRFVQTASSGDFLMSRGLFYVYALSIFRQYPIFGIGWRKIMILNEADVHNIYIQLLAETGLVGFLFYVSLFVYGLYLSIKEFNWISKHLNNETRKYFCLLSFSTFYICFFVLYGLTGNPLYDEQTFYVFMMTYGAVLYFRKYRKNLEINTVNECDLINDSKYQDV